MRKIEWGGTLEDAAVLQAQYNALNAAGRPHEMLSNQQQVVLMACAIMAGKTRAQALAALRQAFDVFKNQIDP